MAYEGLFENLMEFAPGEPPEFPRGGGVFLLTDAEDRFVQLGSAGDLRRALRNRLLDEEQPETGSAAPPDAEAPAVAEPQAPLTSDTPAPAVLAPGPKRKLKLAEVVRRIRWRSGNSQFELDFQYYRVARALLPDRYLKQVAFGPAWFVHVDPEAAIPRLAIGKALRSPPGLDLGPFISQSDVTRFVQILQDAFDLCRYEHILEQVPQGQPCAYFEMGRCPAPCDGSVSMGRYREMIAGAVAFACGERAPLLASLDSQMRAAAAQRAFEMAASIKQRLERARGIDHESFRYVRAVDAFNYLIVQRGGTRTRVTPFFVRRGRIEPGQTVRLRDVETHAAGWREELIRPDASAMDARERSEHISLVSHFLFRREPGGLFLHASTMPGVQELAVLVRERFAQPPKSDSADAGSVTEKAD